MKAVVFDLDGTLVDSAPDIHAAANALLSEMGYSPLSLDTVRSFIGNGIPKLVERVMAACEIELEPALHTDLSARFSAFYSAEPATRTAPYPGVVDALSELEASQYVLGVCTNKDHALTMQVLEGLGLASFFGAVVGGDSLNVRKPDAAPLLDCARRLGSDDILYVGDSEVDAATAQNAMVPFALFTEGYRKSPVDQIASSFDFDDFGALPGIVARAFRAELAS